MVAGDVLDITGQLLQLGAQLDGPFFDGSFAQGAWTVTPDNSTSSLAPVQYIIDGEAPLDKQFTYLLANPSEPGYDITSQVVTLNKYNEYSTWATHPSSPSYPIHLWVETAPNMTRPIDQGNYVVIGRSKPIVRSSTVRQAESGQITMVTQTHSDRARLEQLLSDGQPLLIRTPATYGYDPQWWMSIGDYELQLIRNDAQSAVRKFVGKFTTCEAPPDYASAEGYGAEITRTLNPVNAPSPSYVTGISDTTLVAPPQYQVKFATGSYSEGMTAAPTDFSSAVPTVVTGVTGFTGNVVSIALPANGVSNPGPGASVETGKQRCELQPNLTGLSGATANGQFASGNVGYFGMAFELAPGFPVATAGQQAIMQLRPATGTGPTPARLEVKGNNLVLNGNNNGWSTTVCPIVAGQRYNVVLGVTFAETAAASTLSVTVNGIPYIAGYKPTGAGTLATGIQDLWKIGLFRDDTITTASTMYIGAVAWDTTPATVQAYISSA